MKTIRNILISAVVLISVLTLLIYSVTWHPGNQEAATTHCPATAPVYNPDQPLRVMSYNTQYFAGKNYVFYYDLPDNQGPDLRPTRADIQATLDGIAELINTHRPDIILLQEVHDGAAATDYQDQLQALLERLPADRYPCHSQAFYWKAAFIPHPAIMGSVGMKLAVLSRFKLKNSTRIQLPAPPMDPVSASFYLKRAILDIELPTTQSRNWHILNTHLDAFAQGSNTMERQVEIARQLMHAFDTSNTPFIFGGDFNLLPPGMLSTLQASQRYLYQEPGELRQLLQTWPSIPGLANIQEDPARWATHYPNDPDVRGPDRTIDYIFHSRQLTAISAQVINTEQTRRLSDHLPIYAEIRLDNSFSE